MQFTKEQIAEISDKLSLLGKTDSSFSLAGVPLSGLEEIAFVQQGQNVRMRLIDMVNNLLIYRATDFINISEKFNNQEFTLSQAITKVANVNRKAGVVITFIDSNTHNWLIYQYKGADVTTWLNTSLWDNIVAQIAPLTELIEQVAGKVPYTGAINNVNLGERTLTADQLIKAGGISTDFLKADGTTDPTQYWHAGQHPTTFSNYGITETPWADYLLLTGGVVTGPTSFGDGTFNQINILNQKGTSQETGLTVWTLNSDAQQDYGINMLGNLGANRKILRVGESLSSNGFTVDWVHSTERFNYVFNQGDITLGGKYIVAGGTSAQYLMADGSVKTSSISLTTTGNGAATLVGDTLNIPTPPTVDSGTYVPLLTDPINITSSSFAQSRYIKVGNYVHASLDLSIFPTSTGECVLTFTIPFNMSSGLAGANTMGTAVGRYNNISQYLPGIILYLGTDTFDLHFTSLGTAVHHFNLQFDYSI